MERVLAKRLDAFIEAEFYMIESELKRRIQEFMESEGKSCSFDPALITPEYVYRMWGGAVAIEEIENGLTKIRKHGFTEHVTEPQINGEKEH